MSVRVRGARLLVVVFRCVLGVCACAPGQDVLPHQGRRFPGARAGAAELPRVQGLHEET